MPLGDIPHLSIIKGDAKSLSIGGDKYSCESDSRPHHEGIW